MPAVNARCAYKLRNHGQNTRHAINNMRDLAHFQNPRLGIFVTLVLPSDRSWAESNRLVVNSLGIIYCCSQLPILLVAGIVALAGINGCTNIKVEREPIEHIDIERIRPFGKGRAFPIDLLIGDCRDGSKPLAMKQLSVRERIASFNRDRLGRHIECICVRIVRNRSRNWTNNDDRLRRLRIRMHWFQKCARNDQRQSAMED